MALQSWAESQLSAARRGVPQDCAPGTNCPLRHIVEVELALGGVVRWRFRWGAKHVDGVDASAAIGTFRHLGQQREEVLDPFLASLFQFQRQRVERLQK